MPGRAREIDLSQVAIDPSDEVLELTERTDAPTRRIFAGLPGPPEAPYLPPQCDPTSLAALWEAAANL